MRIKEHPILKFEKKKKLSFFLACQKEGVKQKAHLAMTSILGWMNRHVSFHGSFRAQVL